MSRSVMLSAVAVLALGVGGAAMVVPASGPAVEPGPAAAPVEAPAPAPALDALVTVYKSASCGCCKAWIDHLRQAGFTVKAIDLDDLTEIKAQAGVTRRLASCHTALVDKYTIEGHVPAADIRRLLKEQPDIAGLAVPGMPMGSPGMEGPSKDPYQTLTFDREGRTSVWASH